jgi:hypothetical protein
MPITPLEVSQNKLSFNADNCKEVMTYIDSALDNKVRVIGAEYYKRIGWSRKRFYQVILSTTLTSTEQEYVRQTYCGVGWKRVDIKNIDRYRGLPGCRIRLFP